MLDKPGAAAEIVTGLEISPDGKALLRPDHTPTQFVAALAGSGHLMDAIRVFAVAIPKREGVWWALQCVRSVPPLAADDHAPVLAAVEAWVKDPDDKKRRECFALAEKAGFATPAACAANAVFFSGGSISTPHNPAVEPPPHITPGAIANAVILAAVMVEPEKSGERLAGFLAVGEQVAAGANRWTEGKKAASAVGAPPVAAPRPAVSPPTAPPPPPRSYY